MHIFRLKACHNKVLILRFYSSSHPVNDVLKTTSPSWVPEAPNDFAFQIDPSSSTSLASDVFHGLSPLTIYQAKKKKNHCINFFKLLLIIQDVFHFKHKLPKGNRTSLHQRNKTVAMFKLPNASQAESIIMFESMKHKHEKNKLSSFHQ